MPSPNLRDAMLKLTLALPNGAANVTTATSIETGRNTSAGNTPGGVEYLVSAPALTTAQLPNAATVTYDVVTSANANLSSPTVAVPGVLVQTGAGGVGAAAATKRFRLPSDALAFVGLKATNSGAGNASGASATLEALV